MDINFEVEVTSRHRAVYHVEAPDAEAAERIAAERWQRSEPSDLIGVDWSELIAAKAVESIGPTRQIQDDELVLRFIHERERLLLRLGGDAVNSAISDAVSAHQTAADLGWCRVTDSGATRIDTVRAARALERLCEDRRLVCFERRRERAGERGEIRLYCTPEYLDLLTSAVNGASPVGG